MIDAGHGAKRRLRYGPTRGARGQIDMRLKLHMVMNLLGRSTVVDVPAVTMAMETEVLATSDSAFDFTAKVTNADVDPTGVAPKVAAKVRASVARMIGMATTLRMDYRGIVLSADMDVPSGVDQTVQQNAAMNLDQTANYVVSKIDGDRAEATVELAQTAPRQVLSMPGTPPDVVATLESLSSSGGGTKAGEPQNAMKASMALDMAMTMVGAPVAK